MSLSVISGFVLDQGGEPDAISINGNTGGNTHDIIVDHVSIAWGTDSALDFYRGAYNVTVQWSILAESLDPSKLMIIGKYDTRDITVHHNLFAHAVQRAPRVHGDGPFDFVNNVVHNLGSVPSQISTTDNPPKINYIGNYFQDGPLAGSASYAIKVSGAAEVYIEGNDVSNAVINNTGVLIGSPHSTPSVNSTSATQARSDVLNFSGDNKRVDCEGSWVTRYSSSGGRDSIDERIVQSVRDDTGPTSSINIVSDPSEVGGYPPIASSPGCADSDGDGMPDAFEDRYGLNKTSSSDVNEDPDGDGYLNIEEYLNGNTTPPPPDTIPKAPTDLRFIP